MPARKRLEIDRRVNIAIGALSPAQRRAVDHVFYSQETFDALASNPAMVRALPGLPLWEMRISPNLRLIFEKTRDGYLVLDLVERATVERFATKPSKKAPPKSPLRKRKKPAAADS